jgi:two-component system, OmpR family, phosphate regulon response regulator PhoB
MPLRALVVDDEPDLARLVGFNLGAAGFDVAIAHDGETALSAAAAQPPHVVVLDLGLPGVDGFEVCRRLPADPRTAKVGVVKPLNVRELVLRAQAVARRTTHEVTSAELLVCGPLVIDRASRQVLVDGAPIELRRLEVLLLEHLVTNRGTAFSRRELLAQVWKVRSAANARIVDVTVSRLRENLGSAADMIETVAGLGYRLRRPAGDQKTV